MKILMSLIMLSIISSCSFPASWIYPDDNFIEEEAEDVILDQTGVKVDFSGYSNEN